ncbi:hypothetical protein Bca4012_004565 [Brassica carinata]
MHDFCFTIPYGMLLIGGGFIGYMKKGSITSFAGGAGAGLLLILAGYLSLNAFKKKKTSTIAVVLQTVISAALTLVMGQRYLLTQKIMPAGLVAVIRQRLRQDSCMNIKTGDKQGRLKLQFFNLHNVSASSWQTLSGKPPVVIARGGFSGVFPDSSSKAYELVSVTTSLNLALWCDLQLTKDGVGICFPNLNLYNDSDVKDVYPNNKEWFSVDFTWKDLSDVNLVQNVKSRSGVFGGSYQILTVEIVAELGAPGLWLNIQNSAFYRQHNLSMRNYVVSLSKRVDFISSPEISFLKSMKKDVTKLIFRFLNQDQIEPFTNQTYSFLSKNLSYIKTFSSGILVPKSYIWPVGSDLYLKPHTSLVTEAHRQGLQVFASEFANDFVFAYNYSYDPTAEYLSFIDSGNFSVDGFLSDFPVTPYRAISCFSHLDTKEDEEPAVVTIISNDGASGDFPGCTDLAYEKAVKDGVDILDCNVQMSKDKIPFCMSSIDLLNTTNVFNTSFRNLSSTVAEIQPKSGIYTFSLTMSQIKTLKPVISNPKEDHALFRNPRNKNVGKFLTLSEFLFLANRYNSLLGVLIKVENAVYLAKHQGISVVDAVLNKTERLTTQEGQTTSIAIMFQSTDKSVLMDFKEKKLIYPDELVYRVDEDIRDVTDSAIKEIMSFAGTIVISKESVLPYNGGLVKKKTDVVARLKASGFRVYVETFSNEFVTQPFDLFSDSTVEIDFFVQAVKIDGIITDFPATTARYRKSQCYREMSMFRTGELLPFGNPRLLSPAQAPYPLLVESDVMEPPLLDVKSKNSTPTKAMAKAIQVFSPRQFTRRSSSRQGIKDCIDANNTLSRFENISYKTDSSRRRFISEEISKLGKGNISAQIFTFRDLCVATKNFNPENQLGEGGFGRVYKGHIETPEKASPLFKDRRKFTLMADPLLGGKYPMKGLYQALAVAAMCLQDEAETRPNMSDVVTALEYLAMTKSEEDGETN